MTYKKVFSSSPFHTKSQNAFSLETRLRRLFIGGRDAQRSRHAFLGKFFEQGRTSNLLDYDVYCDVSFPHVVGIFGSRGSGKSFDLGVLLEDIFLPDQDKPVRDAGIVFDIQDQFWTLAYCPQASVSADRAQLDILDEWGLAPRAIEHLSVLVPSGSDTAVPNTLPFSLSPEQMSPADWLAILELERYSPMGQALLNLLSDVGPETPARLASRIGSCQSLAIFQQGTIDGLRWRLQSLSESRVIGNEGISIDALLQPGRVSVILMRNLSDAIRGLIVGVVARLAADRMGRVQQQRKIAMRTGLPTVEGEVLAGRLWLVLDEAHVLVPSDGSTAATQPLIDYVKRGRDAGLSLIFATQQPSAVDSKLMSQVDLTVTHTLGFDSDISAAIARMPTRSALDYEISNEKVGSLADVIRSLGPGEAIIADGSSPRAFIAKVRPRLSAHGGTTPQP